MIGAAGISAFPMSARVVAQMGFAEDRQNYLLNSLSDTQTIITCTGLDEFVKNRFQVDKVFHVVKGQVEVIDE